MTIFSSVPKHLPALPKLILKVVLEYNSIIHIYRWENQGPERKRNLPWGQTANNPSLPDIKACSWNTDLCFLPCLYAFPWFFSLLFLVWLLIVLYLFCRPVTLHLAYFSNHPKSYILLIMYSKHIPYHSLIRLYLNPFHGNR